MTACPEIVEIFGPIDDLKVFQREINKFIKTLVSKIIDLKIYSHNEIYQDRDNRTLAFMDKQKTTHYAYLRYIPQ